MPDLSNSDRKREEQRVGTDIRKPRRGTMKEGEIMKRI
jgi:hypothetical protein